MTQQYSAAEMLRMMKLQDVLLKAMAKKITWWDAAEIIGVTDRQDGHAKTYDLRYGVEPIRLPGRDEHVLGGGRWIWVLCGDLPGQKKMKLRILCEKLLIISQWFFGIPPFRFYSLAGRADGIKKILSQTSPSPPTNEAPSLQLELLLGWEGSEI